jgi:hypothetical protein
MRSSEGRPKWLTRWKCEVTTKRLHRGVWALKSCRYLVRTRVVHPRTGKKLRRNLHKTTLSKPETDRARIQSAVRDHVNGRRRTPP